MVACLVAYCILEGVNSARCPRKEHGFGTADHISTKKGNEVTSSVTQNICWLGSALVASISR